ncbi:MAG TPA: DUF2339 domain-containing protein [Ureibacillus sp.]|nr:DUF2339 domain-containing protein [Ureibacillus sp.]
MQNETDKRIERLEMEVRALRLELNALKGENNSLIDTSIQTELQNQQVQTKQTDEPDRLKSTEYSNQFFPHNQGDPTTQDLSNSADAENHLIKLNKAASAKLKKQSSDEPVNHQNSLMTSSQPKKESSFEEIILWLLPKVFMLILVLGVLWGLKVMSDFGLLSNGLKIVLAYVLSIALIVIGRIMEIKKPKSTEVFTIVLYGGAFIIGILTTAAGAILYEVLGLYLALFITVCFIAYGLTICYLKKNEVLSVFVIFTSLLLPYLLEYMDFNGMIILLYVLFVYGAMQHILVKHEQSITLFLSFIFSNFTVEIIWSLNNDGALLYVFSCILLHLIFILAWWQLYKPFSKWHSLYEGLLFSLSGITILIINSISNESVIPFILLLVIFASLALYANKRSEKRVVDIAGTLSILAIVNIIIVINAIDQLEIVLLPLCSFLGLLLGVKLNAKLMKILYSILFAFFVFVHLITDEIKPFWTMEHLNYLLIFFYLIALNYYLKQSSNALINKDRKVKVNFTFDILPVLIAIYFFIYVFKIDITYLTNSHAYLTAFVVAFSMIISLFISEKIIGKGLRVVLILAFFLTYINLLPTHYVEGIDIWWNLLVRILYAVIIIGIVIDVYRKGYLHQLWFSNSKIDIDGFLTVGVVGAMVFLYALLSQLQADWLMNHFLIVTSKTILLFLTASISLGMSTRNAYRKVKIMGYIVLAIAIIKLIFFDLDTLNLIIRALLFMIIGGIGLILSNRLLSNQNSKDKE